MLNEDKANIVERKIHLVLTMKQFKIDKLEKQIMLAVLSGTDDVAREY
jgi:hypothetical protein